MPKEDDPIEASIQLNEAERRSEIFPFKSETATVLAAFCAIAAAAFSGTEAIAASTVGAVLATLQSIVGGVAIRRQEELIKQLHREFHEQGVTKDYLDRKLVAAKSELQELAAEAVVRASEAKSDGAVRRIAKLLTKVLVTTEEIDIEEARAMLNIAGNLLDFDAVVLGRMYQEQSVAIEARHGNVDINDTRASWERLRNSSEAFRSPKVNAIGSRLQAHGLAMRVEVGPQAFGLDTYVFSITDFGIRFCRWCLSGQN